MARGGYLGEFELMVMLALIRLRNEAYGVPISREIEQRSGRQHLSKARTPPDLPPAVADYIHARGLCNSA